MSIDLILINAGTTKRGLLWDVLIKDTGEKIVEGRVNGITSALDTLANQGHQGKPWRVFDEQGRLLMTGAKIKAKKPQ